jgi:hypothetical protein
MIGIKTDAHQGQKKSVSQVKQPGHPSPSNMEGKVPAGFGLDLSQPFPYHDHEKFSGILRRPDSIR